MKKVFFDDLTRDKRGRIYWKKSIGKKFKFIYDDIEGEIEIVGVKSDVIITKYINEINSIYSSELNKGKIEKIIGKGLKRKHKYKVNDIITNLNSGRLRILKLIRMSNGIGTARGYEYQCLICENKDKITEYDITKMVGCNVCCTSPQKVLIGINDIHTTNPDLGKLLWDYEDGYSYTEGSSRKVDWKCLDCNEKIKNKKIEDIRIRGLSCPKCSDGYSFPNKIMYLVLRQLKIDFEAEYAPKWANKRRYDFSSDELNCTIEVHGGQHYEQTKRKGARSLAEEQENDILKEKLHRENSTREYIVIRGDISILEEIKKNILNSKLSELIDISVIDWTQVYQESQKSFVKIACEYFEINKLSLKEVSELMKLSNVTIIKYLKIGSNLGWCSYDPKKEKEKNSKRIGKMNGEKWAKPVVRLSLTGEYIDEYKSAKEAGRQLDISKSGITSTCNGKLKSAGGFIWLHKDIYLKNKKEIRTYKNNLFRSVVQLDINCNFISKYNNAREASRTVNIDSGGISRACSGVQKTSAGFKWMYEEDYEKMLVNK